MILGKILAERF